MLIFKFSYIFSKHSEFEEFLYRALRSFYTMEIFNSNLAHFIYIFLLQKKSSAEKITSYPEVTWKSINFS